MLTPSEKFDQAYALHAEGKVGEALLLYQQVVAAEPRHAHAWHQLGCIAAQFGKLSEAERYFVQAIRLDGRQALYHNNLGDCYRTLNQLDKAQKCFQQAIRLDPDDPMPRVNLCLTLYALDRRDEAEQTAREALALVRTSAEDHRVASSLLLLRGEYREGWAEFEWRMQTPGYVRPALPGRAWTGEPLSGERILLWAEQGLGDVLQFVRYAADVAARGGRPVLLTSKSMFPLLREAEICELAALDEPPPECKFHAALMSLPHWFHTTLETVPAQVPYLRAKQSLVHQWRQRLAGISGVRIGICWQGNPKFGRDAGRSVPLAAFAPLARVAGVRLVCLQKFAGLEQLDALAGAFDVVDLRPDYDVEDGAFMNAAAIMQNLDLVISPDTAIAHLAGALGVPVWTMLPKVPDWRWLLDRADTPWYPTMRLFRQSQAGDWSGVIAQMRDAFDRKS
jgi:tetratricopeptide (TPR) repeat protein